MSSKAKKWVSAGKSRTTKNGKPFFEPPKGDFGIVHYGSSSEDLSNYILFDDNSIVTLVDDCIISVFNNETGKFE